MADDKKTTQTTAKEGLETLDYTERLALATANIDRIKAEGESYKNAKREEESQKAKDAAKQQDEEKRRLEEEEKKRKKIAEERLAALSYAENYRERLRKERDNAALEKRRMEAERRRKEQLEKELEASDALIEQQRRENSDRTAKFDEIIARISTAMSAPEKVDTPPVPEEQLTAVLPTLEEAPTEQAAAPAGIEPLSSVTETEEENYILNISTEEVGRDLLHIEGMSVGDISLYTPKPNNDKEECGNASIEDKGGAAPIALGTIGVAAAAIVKNESEGDEVVAFAPSKESLPIAPKSAHGTPIEKEKAGSVLDLDAEYPDPAQSPAGAPEAVKEGKDTSVGEKFSRAEQKKMEREEYKRFLAENGTKQGAKRQPVTDDDPYENIAGGVYDISEPDTVPTGKNIDFSAIDEYEKGIESRSAYSESDSKQVKPSVKDGGKLLESAEPEYPDPSHSSFKKTSGKETRRQKKEVQDRERQALLEADRLAREEDKRKASLSAKAGADSAKVKEYPDYDTGREKAKRDRRAEAEELAAFAKEDEKNRRKNKDKKGKDRPKAAPISKDAGEKFDKKKIEALVKEQSKNDEKLVKLHFENRIRALKFESDSLDLRFSAPVGREKKNRVRMGYSINETKKNAKLAARLERADNERYYNLVKCDLDRTKLPRRADRAEIEKMRAELIELLNRRDELNLALSELYTGRGGKKKSRSHAVNAEAKEYKAKVKEFKRQRKLAKDMDRMQVSSDNRKKIYQLMDECVELAGKRAEIEYRLHKEKIKGKAKREAKKAIRRVRKDYKYATLDLRKLSNRAFEKAAKRNKSRHATALGVFLLLLLVGGGVAVYFFRDAIWQFITSLIPV